MSWADLSELSDDEDFSLTSPPRVSTSSVVKRPQDVVTEAPPRRSAWQPAAPSVPPIRERENDAELSAQSNHHPKHQPVETAEPPARASSPAADSPARAAPPRARQSNKPQHKQQPSQVQPQSQTKPYQAHQRNPRGPRPAQPTAAAASVVTPAAAAVPSVARKVESSVKPAPPPAVSAWAKPDVPTAAKQHPQDKKEAPTHVISTVPSQQTDNDEANGVSRNKPQALVTKGHKATDIEHVPAPASAPPGPASAPRG